MPAQYDLVETVGLCPNHEFNGIVGVLEGSVTFPNCNYAKQ